MRPTVLITKPLTKTALAALAEHFETVSIVKADDPDAVMAQHADAIRAIAGGKVSKAMMDRLPKLEIIANEGVGVDTTDVPVAKDRGIIVTNTPDVLNDAVAELTVALMLALARAIPQADQFVRTGGWAGGMYGLGTELRGKSVGILGLGRIGKEIATRLAAMKMDIAYCGRSKQDDQPYRYFADPVEMAAAVEWYVVIAPGGKATGGIVSREVINALGTKGKLINVSRGSLVDQDALVDALVGGRLGGAALDVFAKEPAVPEALLGMDNVVLSPHQGSRTHETREGMGRLVVENLVAHFSGQPLPSRVA